MKKLFAALTAFALCLSLVACGSGGSPSTAPSTGGAASTTTEGNATNEGGQSPEDFKTFTIGVCEAQAIDEVVIRRDYYENYIAPRYNVQFIFSEQVTDTEGELSFIENIVYAGADAFISFRSEDANQLAQVCEEYGLYYAINAQRSDVVEGAFTSGLPTFLGSFAADQPYVGQLFKEWMLENASEDGSEGFMIASSLAFRGNTQHSECTEAILTALQELYDLTYEDTIPNLAATSAPLEVANDKDIEIYIYPGTVSTNENWLQGISAGLQTGKYGVFVQSGQTFTSTAVVVDEVERTFNMDIKVATVASVSESLTNAYQTQDMFGNASLDMSTIKITSINTSMAFVQVYNALTGYAGANFLPNGEPGELLFKMWAATTLDEVLQVGKWDIAGGDIWVADQSVIDQCLGIYNPDITYADIQAVYDSLTFEEAKARLG